MGFFNSIASAASVASHAPDPAPAPAPARAAGGLLGLKGVLAPAPPRSQNIFWEIDGIKGESTSAQGKDMIEVMAFHHGVHMPLTAGPSNTSRASGRCVHDDFVIVKQLDLSSPTLNLKCSGGEDIKSMKLHFWKADAAGKPLEFLTYTFESCIITEVDVKASSDQPVEKVSFSYKKVTWDYNQQLQGQPGGAKGKTSSSWSLEKNTGA